MPILFNYYKYLMSFILSLYLVGLAFALPPRSSAHELDCRPWNNIFVPVRLPFAQAVGRPGFGFSFARDCYSSVFDSHDGYVCQFLGGNQFGVFHASTNQLMAILAEPFPFQSFANCRALTSQTGSDQICIPDGLGFSSGSPLRIPSITGQYSYRHLEDCSQSLSNASEIHLCYLDSRRDVRLGHRPSNRPLGLAFDSLADCHLSTASVSAGENRVCAPLVDGFTIFDGVKARKIHFSTLDDCLQAIMEE